MTVTSEIQTRVAFQYTGPVAKDVMVLALICVTTPGSSVFVCWLV